MNKKKMKSMMPEMMEKMFAGMTVDDKEDMMMGMMAKMKEGIDMQEMMPKIMMGMMSAKEGEGGMKEMMAEMMQRGEAQESMMPEMMLKGMMPHCIKMMMPAIPKDKRADLVPAIVGTIMEQASRGMSDEEKATFAAKVVEAIKI